MDFDMSFKIRVREDATDQDLTGITDLLEQKYDSYNEASIAIHRAELKGLIGYASLIIEGITPDARLL